MEVRAIAKYVRVQPRKVRIIAREVKGEPAIMSAHKLRFHPSKGAFALRKVLVSAIANASENHGVSPEALRIKSINIDEGPRIKRMTQKAMGRGARIIKKTSHITVIVEDYVPTTPSQKPGANPKPRPKFDAPKKAKAAKPAKAEVVEETPTEVEEVIEETTQEENA